MMRDVSFYLLSAVTLLIVINQYLHSKNIERLSRSIKLLENSVWRLSNLIHLNEKLLDERSEQLNEYIHDVNQICIDSAKQLRTQIAVHEDRISDITSHLITMAEAEVESGRAKLGVEHGRQI